MKNPIKLKRKNIEVPERRRNGSSEIKQRGSEDAAGRSLFRRGRTLVGSLSPEVVSASELHGELKSPRAKHHHLSSHRRRLGGYFIAVLAAIVFLTWFIYDFTAGIAVESSLRTDSPINSSRYVNAINNYFGRSPLERLRTFTNQENLTDYLRRVVPEVENVESVEGTEPAESEFVLSFREPVASWQIGNELYYVDKSGVPFKVNYFAKPTVKIIDNSGVPQVAGAAVVSGRFLRFVGLAVDTAKRLYGVTVKQAIIPENTTREVDLKIAKKPFPIKLSLDRAVGLQIEDMSTASDYLHQKGITPKYLDVRVSGKAYYK